VQEINEIDDEKAIVPTPVKNAQLFQEIDLEGVPEEDQPNEVINQAVQIIKKLEVEAK
jgi:hypothetical protein